MISKLNVKIADRILSELDSNGCGPLGRALKVLRNYRKAPSDSMAKTALSYLNGLDQRDQLSVKQAARL